MNVKKNTKYTPKKQKKAKKMRKNIDLQCLVTAKYDTTTQWKENTDYWQF